MAKTYLAAGLLHTMYSEVCGTDVHLHHGKLAGVSGPADIARTDSL